MDTDVQARVNALGAETLDNLAQALWLPAFDLAQLSPELAERLASEKNSNEAFGERMRRYLDQLMAHPDSFTPSYRKRYEAFRDHTSALTPHQAHALTDLFGPDADQGYEEIPGKVNFEFPQAHLADLNSELGWYYIVGSAVDAKGTEYGVILMFYREALLPPPLAHELGLTDIENQVIDMQFGINRSGDTHYQAVPICLAGTTGLVEYGIHPFHAAFGKNTMDGLAPDDLFPLRVQARGWDRGKAETVEMEMDITFSSGKGILLNGKDGVMSIGGIGTPYYSIPNLMLDPTHSRLRIGQDEIALTAGQFWFDHQWGTLGDARVEVIRAAANLAPSSPGGWDWFELQFEGDRQMMVYALHTADNAAFYHQEGDESPGTMTVAVNGKYMDEHKLTHDYAGTLRVTQWLKSAATPDPQQYWGTHTWHPAHWEFAFEAPIPPEIRHVSLEPLTPTGSLLYFNSGQPYQEAPVHILNEVGRVVGRGYAEAVHYAEEYKNRLALAGLPQTDEMLSLLAQPTPTRLTRVWSTLYLLLHKHELESAVANGA